VALVPVWERVRVRVPQRAAAQAKDSMKEQEQASAQPDWRSATETSR
jgi:hypothetical protein